MIVITEVAEMKLFAAIFRLWLKNDAVKKVPTDNSRTKIGISKKISLLKT